MALAESIQHFVKEVGFKVGYNVPTRARSAFQATIDATPLRPKLYCDLPKRNWGSNTDKFRHNFESSYGARMREARKHPNMRAVEGWALITAIATALSITLPNILK